MHPQLKMKIIPTLLASLLVVSCSIQAAHWSALRGSDGTAVSPESEFPLSWSAKENIAWKTTLSGKGTSSPVVHGNLIFVTTQLENEDLMTLSFDLKTGRPIWEKKMGNGRLPTHDFHNMATPTPVTDGKHVWVFFGTGDLVCLTISGEEVWRRNLRTEYADYNTNHGMGNSPLLHDGSLYIACMHQGPSYLLALNAANGKTLWKKDRNLGAREEGNDSYSTPIVVEVNGHDQIVLSGAEHLNAYDPITGKEIWRVGDLQVPHSYGRTIAGPTAGEGKVITVASGFRNQGFLVGVTPAHEGDSAVVEHDWKQKRYSPDCPTPVIYGGKVFTIRDDGMASCIDIKTGNAHWQERLFAENVKVSPVAANGYIYFTTGRANTKVLKASETFEIVATNELNEETLSTPALSSGNIIIRTFESLYCIR
jgi:outer membrane protein assembly factor BamB